MLTDGGSNPPASTKLPTSPDPWRARNTLSKQLLTDSGNKRPEVSVGLCGSPKRHENDTSARSVTPPSEGRSEKGGTQGRLYTPSYPEEITEDLGTLECRKFRARIFAGIPDWSITVARQYVRICAEASYIEANRQLLQIHQTLNISDLNLGWGDQEIRSFAEMQSIKCVQAELRLPSIGTATEYCIQLAKKYALAPPQNTNPSAIINRLKRPQWWRSQVKQKQKQRVEDAFRAYGLINKARNIYCSNAGVAIRKQQHLSNQSLLENSFLENDTGDRICLADIAEHSLSNPAVRRAELMTRIRGFDEIAKLNNDCGEFYTFTCPSRMHSHSIYGRRNPKFDGTTTAECQQHLNHTWSLIRAKLGRENIHPYGFRVVEPHHDGTPHWHLLLFVPPEQKSALRKICRHYLLQIDGNEAGAQKRRFKAEAIDPKKGSAAGYIAKYIAKNVDGAHIEKDTYGKDAKTSARHIEAWASAHKIRQFQQIGGPSATVWRELRRLREPHTNPVLEAARAAADIGSWAAYIIAMGGVNIKRALRPLKPFREVTENIDKGTGEITPKKNRFGEVMKASITGLKLHSMVIKTRLTRWHPALPPKPLRGGGIGKGFSPPTPPPRGGNLGLV